LDPKKNSGFNPGREFLLRFPLERLREHPSVPIPFWLSPLHEVSWKRIGGTGDFHFFDFHSQVEINHPENSGFPWKSGAKYPGSGREWMFLPGKAIACCIKITKSAPS
jgi:hypothetical protein